MYRVYLSNGNWFLTVAASSRDEALAIAWAKWHASFACESDKMMRSVPYYVRRA